MKYKIPECIGTRFRKLSRIIDGQYRKCAGEFGITEHQMSVLLLLYEKGKTEQGMIGKMLGLERSTISRNVKLLSRNDLLTKSNDYQPAVALTQKGEALVVRILPKWESLMEKLVTELGEGTLAQLSIWEKRML